MSSVHKKNTPDILVLEPDSRRELDVYVDALCQAFPEARVHPAECIDDAMAAPPADIVVAKGVYLTQDLIDRQVDLAWVHSLISGEDALRRLSFPTGPVVTVTRGVHAPQVSELAVLLMMALARDLPGFLAAQAAAKWRHRNQPTLAGKTALIVGLGRISEYLTGLLSAYGMTVDGVSNRDGCDGIRRIWSYEKLGDAVTDADFVIALLPLSDRTKGIFGREVFARMKPEAFFINVARGGVVDEEAMIDALRKGTIAGAGLDVFSTEPLPPDHPLWKAPNVILTPHVGGRSVRYAENATPLLIEAARAFFDDRPQDMPFRVEI